MKLEIKDIQGKATGKTIELPAEIFTAEANEHVVYLAIKQFLANQRQGTHKAKERAEVAGSRKKIRKQKGSGAARVGDIKNPIFRGGGRVFGPRPRDYGFKLNKKVKQQARIQALSDKAQKGAITIVDNYSFEAAKTKDMIAALQNLGVANQKALIISADTNINLDLSARNIPNAATERVDKMSTYNLMNAQQLIFDVASINKLAENAK